ncbi:SirB2 family protein [Methylomonas sp. DH-1]|uniref:SirB2 family protein n=1 Tax=Methylomonas sp. (strain DH-1) TaxID=1727196 RepID=UPI001E50DADA|nr:SirB2 family protein [Methylomonas sp. DH-1]
MSKQYFSAAKFLCGISGFSAFQADFDGPVGAANRFSDRGEGIQGRDFHATFGESRPLFHYCYPGSHVSISSLRHNGIESVGRCLISSRTLKDETVVKHLHLLLAALVAVSFIARVLATQVKPELLQRPLLKIAPHALASLLLISGIVLVFQGGWLAGSFGWIVAKVLALPVFIGLGMVAIRQSGQQRWLAFSGAMLVLFYIAGVAVHKQAFFFL